MEQVVGRIQQQWEQFLQQPTAGATAACADPATGYMCGMVVLTASYFLMAMLQLCQP